MRNRAKCKLCGDILESFHRYDYVTCKCGEISIDGGLDYCKASAKDWQNFLRVDDEGNEIIITVKEKAPDTIVADNIQPSTKPCKADLVKILDEMVKRYESLPSGAMVAPVYHYDFVSLLLFLSSWLRCED